MSGLPFARLVVHAISSIGVSKVIHDIVKNNTTVVTTVDAVRVWTGSIVISSLIAEHASKHVNERMDTVLAWNEKRTKTVSEVASDVVAKAKAAPEIVSEVVTKINQEDNPDIKK